MVALLLDLFFGAIGSGYFLYGRRQASASFAISGFLLAIFPWFISSAVSTLIVGVLLCAAPFVLARFNA